MEKSGLSDEEWNAFVEKNGGSVFQRTEFAELLHECMDYEPRMLAEKSGGKIEGVFPAMKAKYALFGHLISMPPNYPKFYEGGPLGREKAKRALAEKFLAESKGCVACFCRLENAEGAKIFEQLGFEKKAFTAMVAEIGKSGEELFAAYHKKTRNAVRKAYGQGFSIREAKGSGDTKTFAAMYEKTMEKLGAGKTFNEKFFLKAEEQLFRKGLGTILLAELEGKAVAGTMLLFSKARKTCHYFSSASDERFLDKNPNNFLLNEAMLFAKKRGFEFFDFGTSATEELERFKERFGGKPREFYAMQKINDAVKWKAWQVSLKAYNLAKGLL